MKRIGILGGTFDPPHIGHLIIAQEVKETLQLDEIWFIPSSQPPHKQKANANASDRLKMVEHAISKEQFFRLHPIEIDRKGTSFTYDTIKQLQAMHLDTLFYFIIGADMVEDLSKWHKIDKLIKMIKFVGVNRPGYLRETSYPIIEIEVPFLEVSSTMIRERVAKKQPIKYFVTEEVQKYIEERGLYE